MTPTLLPPKNIAFLVSATIAWLASTTPPPQPAPEPIKVKLVLAGNFTVGKSSLLLQFCDREWFPENRPGPNIGVDFRVYWTEVDGRRVKVQLWDTAGQERFGAMGAMYYRGAQGVILVYDVSSRKSFQALPHWLEQIENHTAPPGAVKLLVGNKLEKEDSREVPTTEGAEFAARNGCLFVEVSAKTGEGVSEAVDGVIARIVNLISPSCGEKQPELLPRKASLPVPGTDGPHASSSEKFDLTSIRREEGSSSRCWN